MTDKEKVIKGLEYHLKELTVGKSCYECPYLGDNPCEIQLIANALALLKEQEDLGTELTNAVELIRKKNERIEKLLKEQEAVEPYSMNAERTYGICPKCWKIIFRYGNVEENHYCGVCGQAVKWE